MPRQRSFTPPADNLTVNEQLSGPHAAGVNSILPKEHGSQFFYLPIIRHSDEEVSEGFLPIDCPLVVAMGHQSFFVGCFVSPSIQSKQNFEQISFILLR